jgi:hypothetical protein
MFKRSLLAVAFIALLQPSLADAAVVEAGAYEQVTSIAQLAKELPNAKDPMALVEIVRSLADDSNAKTIASMVSLTTDQRVKHRLAEIAIRYGAGTTAAFAALYDGLTSSDPAIRTDAAAHFHVEHVPSAERPRFLPIFEAQRGVRPLDATFATTLVMLGSEDRPAFELLFGTLTDGVEVIRRQAVKNVARYAAYVAPALRAELAGRIEKALQMSFVYAPDHFKQQLERALVKLRA